MGKEGARYWRHPALPGVDLMRAKFVKHRFSRHAHEGYTIGLVESGVEEFDHPRGVWRAGPGSIAIVNPGVVHTGHAGVPEGWTYRVLYPAEDLVKEVAAELGSGAGTPTFPFPVLDDPPLARALRAVHRAGEAGDGLAASTLLRAALGNLLSRHAGIVPVEDGLRALPAAVSAARDILHAEMVEPPSLEELAVAVGVRPFALLRAFRAAFGLPPHAYLNQARVRAARVLLDEGLRPVEVAARTGFADQAHLTRHFKRAMGVPPGVYQAAALPARSLDPGAGRR